MGVKDTARGAIGGPVGDRLRGERPGVFRAAAAAAVAGGMTAAVVFRLLRRGGDEDED
jgi:hypothetical protein